MTGQIPDFILYDNEEYDLVGFRGEGLLTPQDFGLTPKSPHTACWRGFVMYYECRENRLLLHAMDVHTNTAPVINGVKATDGGNSSFNYHYEGIDVDVPFSGSLVLAREFIDSMYVHMGFQRLQAFKTVLELIVKNGHIVKAVDQSEKIKKAREKNPDMNSMPSSDKETDIMKWIRGRFSRDITPEDIE
jgi:hypothetical protein